jgi:hypothetical protein
MNILQLYQDHGVDFKTEGHKHTHQGWVHTPCPFCEGNPGYHLGIPLENPVVFSCWRCGTHGLIEGISGILSIGKAEAYRVVKQYDTNIYVPPTKDLIPVFHPFKFPTHCEPLSDRHKKYLEKRDFDPDKLVNDWELTGTGVISTLDNIPYKNRIIIPIHWAGKVVSFTSRDITDKDKDRYKTCSKSRETVFHKSIIYRKNGYKPKKTGICVEGPTDVWRLGHDSFATFGIKYRPEQIRTMCMLYERIPVLYDDDPQADIQAEGLVGELRFRGIDSFRERIKGDPGGLPQSEADYIVKQLIK